ncbi:hypothetical protein B0H13DRAFT_2358083 [Mycena leptocephala]|nr:hypothetical protein B0H13DRAFT_2358083 [Mycena leptocephala]
MDHRHSCDPATISAAAAVPAVAVALISRSRKFFSPMGVDSDATSHPLISLADYVVVTFILNKLPSPAISLPVGSA